MQAPTPMALRKDAMRAAAELMLEVVACAGRQGRTDEAL